MRAKRAAASIVGIILLATLATGAQAAPSSQASANSAPAEQRSFSFTYHADIPVTNPSAKKLEAWIPLPRDDAFQQVRDLKIDTPAHFELVNQDSNRNRIVTS